MDTSFQKNQSFRTSLGAENTFFYFEDSSNTDQIIIIAP